MSNNESRRYKHDIKRQGDIAKRPVEMFKREYTDKTSLVLKSRNVPENEIFMEKNGIKSVNPIFINTNVIPFQMSIDLDLSKSKYLTFSHLPNLRALLLSISSSFTLILSPM